MAELTLYLPGLMGPFLRFPDEPLLPLSSLYRLLQHARQNRIPAKSYTHRLAELFHFPANTPLPAAAISRLVDDAARPQGAWLRADPIHLELKHTDYIVHDAERLTLTRQDALIFAALIQPLFHEQLMELEVPHPKRWYVHLNGACNTVFHPVDSVNGTRRDEHYPQGEQARVFSKLLSDCQTLLEASELNEQRQQRGELAINGVWFWGAGNLPEVLQRRWSRVYSDDPLVKGLCLLSSTDEKNLDDYDSILDQTQPGEQVLLIDSRLDGLEKHQRLYDWQQQMLLLEELYLNRLMPALGHSAIESITLLDTHYSFQLLKTDLLKVWRRFTSLPSLFKKLSLL